MDLDAVCHGGTSVNVITVHLSDQTLVRIEELAAMNHRTVEEEAAAILERAVQESLTRKDVYLLCEQIAAMTSKDVPQTDGVDLLSEDRDR